MSETRPDLDRLRLFPLGGAFVFPFLATPLHIFEPRYREMTADALAGDGLIAVVQPDPSRPARGPDEPAVLDVAGVGRIVEHERFEDGRYNIVLAGIGRAKLVDEYDSDSLYRVVRAEWLEDTRDPDTEETLADSARKLAAALAAADDSRRAPVWMQLANAKLDAEVLSNVFPQIVYGDPEPKQAMLELTSVPARMERLVDELQTLLLASTPSGDPV